MLNLKKTKEQIEDAIGIDCSNAILTSAKEGIGTKKILESIIKNIPPPEGDNQKPLKALIFDSWFDNYQGVIVLVRISDGCIKAGKKIKLMATDNVFEVSSEGRCLLYRKSCFITDHYEKIEEPVVIVTVFSPKDFIGPILDLCQEKRGIQKNFTFIGKDRIRVKYELPLNEILWDFYNRLKSISKGYASLDYDFLGYRESDLVKLNILLNGEAVDALSLIVHRENAYYKGRDLCERLKEVIRRQLFEVIIQASIGNKIIARESIRPLRKDVTAKCYGGDITRKRKPLEKQREGKKKMKQFGKVELPQEALLAVLKVR